MRPPGRENRIKEAPYTKVEDYVQAVAETLKRDYSDKPFAFFGHRYKQGLNENPTILYQAKFVNCNFFIITCDVTHQNQLLVSFSYLPHSNLIEN